MRDVRYAAALAAAILAHGSGDLPASPPIELSGVAAGNGGFIIRGSDNDDYTGHSVSAAGDVNGDGLADLIVGSPDRNDASGEAYVVFGKTDGAPVAAADVRAGTGGFSILGDEDRSEKAGYSVSGAGDMNGDGFDDLIVSAPFRGFATFPGRCFVVFGKASSSGVLLEEVTNGSGGFVIDGFEPNSFTGWEAAGGGDVNGDGLADVIIGSPEGVQGFRYGRAFVVFGKTDGEPVDLESVGSDSAGFAIEAIEERLYTGAGVSIAGDVNGDGLADLIVGAPKSIDSYDRESGEAYVIFGKPDFATVALLDVAAGSGGFLIDGIDRDDRMGYGVSSAGDVNGDGLVDLFAGARTADPRGDSNAGEGYVIFGKPDGFPVDLISVASGLGGFVMNGIDAEDFAAWDVGAAGDVNADGISDLILGAPFADPGGRSRAGESYLILGKSDGTAVDLAAIAAGSGGFVINGAAAGELSGFSVSGAGDVNGDGRGDLIVGAERWGASGNRPGAAYVVFSPENPPLVPPPTVSSEVTFIAHSRAGDGAGEARTPAIVFKDARVRIDFTDGDFGGAGLGVASTERVTLARTNAAIENLPAEAGAANVLWRIETDREFWSRTEIRFRYLDHETVGLSKEGLAIFRAPDPSGPWSLIETERLPERGEVRANVESFGFFALAVPLNTAGNWANYR